MKRDTENELKTSGWIGMILLAFLIIIIVMILYPFKSA
jgi:hypothetical protein